jgi:hypothetical protein
MDHHADLVVAFLVVVAFARSCRTSSFVIATEGIVETKEHHSGESKSQKGAIEYEPCMDGSAQVDRGELSESLTQYEIIALSEAQWIVEVTGFGYEAVCCRFA